jgi:hypothetical protein
MLLETAQEKLFLVQQLRAQIKMKKFMKTQNKECRGPWIIWISFAGIFFMILFSCLNIDAATPEGPTSVNVTSNTTSSTNSAYVINVSGGYIAALNITANIRNTRWKGFVGWVTGRFALSDGTGSTLFDWSLSTNTGKVYATRNSSTISWPNINCSNLSMIERENYNFNHTNPQDNITRTFNDTSHAEFYVGTKHIAANSCRTLNTYVNNQSSNEFEEMVLDDSSSLVYATLFENNQQGYNSLNYNFQMIVPENGAPSFSGSTAYYLYVELT